MPSCEDFPCCGHEMNDCPTEDGRISCVDCGRLFKPGGSSICDTCLVKYSDPEYLDLMDDWEGEFD